MVNVKVFHLQQQNSFFKVHIVMYLEIGLKYEYLDSTTVSIYFHFQFHAIIEKNYLIFLRDNLRN